MTEMESFWVDHGRHNGLNVNVVTADGFVLEIQFPTELSRHAGDRTHSYYEDVRHDSVSAAERVHAFLEILRINRDLGVFHHRPEGLELLEDLPTAHCDHVDTTFGAWLRSRPGLLAAYQMTCIGRSRSVGWVEVYAVRGVDDRAIRGASSAQTQHFLRWTSMVTELEEVPRCQS